MPWRIIIQPRDLGLLHDLFVSRVMTLMHVAKLHFDGSFEAAKKRCQKLKSAGYLKERPRRINEASVMILTSKAIDLISKQGLLTGYPKLGLNALEKRSQVSEATLPHELAVMDVKAAMISSLKEPFKIVEFTSWPQLNEFSIPHPQTRRPFTVKPDGFIRIREGKEHDYTFYLELDRSTETVETLVQKARCYLHYYRSGGLAVKYGRDRSAYQDCPFRVIMVFKTVERRNNIAIKLLQVPILTHVWLSTIEEVVKNPLGNIWLCPLDMRWVTYGTPIMKTREKNGCHTKRDRINEDYTPKRKLFTGGTSL